MAIWYEVEHSESGIYNFMECNCRFHDFKIARVSYHPDDYTAELFLLYDELERSIILRFIHVQEMRVSTEASFGLMNEIEGSVLLLTENGQFLWIADDIWGDQSKEHIEELNKEASWVQAERIIWAMTDSRGFPTELPADMIDQTWMIYGKEEHHHFELTPCKELK